MAELGDTEYERLRAWADLLDDSSYYEILGLLELADDQAIKSAFHEFALAFHPDSHVGESEEMLDCVRYIFRRGAEAYRVLSDPRLRSEYDLALARGKLRLTAPGEVQVRSPSPDGSVHAQSIEDLCRSPAARLCGRRADQYISAGDLRAARHELTEALAKDGYENPELEERVDALDSAIFLMGD
jgi:curved DNA-binding protein CbpA